MRTVSICRPTGLPVFSSLFADHVNSSSTSIRRKLEAVIDCRELELWKQKDLVEELKQELDDRDAELDEIDDALAKSRERYDQHTSYWRGLLDDVRGGKYR